jgi:ribokinase
MSVQESLLPHITVVGSINMDLVVRVDHLPEPGETILGRDYRTIPGGKGANQAVAAARLGAQVDMVGRVGKDAFGGMLRENLQREGVNVSSVADDPDVSSGIALITLDEMGRNTIVVASGTNMTLATAQVKQALEGASVLDAVVMQLEIPMDCVVGAAWLGSARGAKVVLNPAPARPLPAEVFPLLDVLVPNENETSLLTGLPVESLEQAEVAARHLLQAGARSVVLTLGGRGALVVEKGPPAVHIPSHPVKVVDTTAAGDAFVAGLAVGLAEGLSLVEAARLGNAAGAIAVTRLGAQPAMPTRSEVEGLLGL